MIASIVAGLIGNLMSSDYSEEEKRQMALALQQYAALAPPEHRDLITREIARSQMTSVRRNPYLEAIQDEVQGGLMEIARSGESARGRADYEQSAMESAQLARSQREGAVSRADALGLGPEAAFSDALLAGQADADRERMAGLQRSASGEEARMSALGAAGSMAGSRSATQWGQDAQVAQAQDDMARFNTGQYNNMQQFNEAGRYRNFDSQLALANARSNAHVRDANFRRDRGQRVREDWMNVGRGVDQALGAAMGAGGVPMGGGGMPTQQAPQQNSPTPAQPMAQSALSPNRRKAR